MNVLVCFVLCFVKFGVYGGVIHNDLFKLDIVHYNDFHARFEETTLTYPVCKSNDTTCIGGFARLYHEIKTLLKEKPYALLLNAGDTFQGTYWYTLLKWNITQKFINLLPNDAHAIGNHEFDDGIAGLVPYLEALRAPVVAANIDTSKEPALNGLYKPHTIVKRNGKKIGIIGLITQETGTSSNSQNVIFLDPLEAAEKEAKLLTEKGVDVIILLSHCGLDIDKKIASNVGENIDIIVGGHSHSLLWNGKPPNGSYVSGPYPTVIRTKKNPKHKVVVVTASAFSKFVGNISVYFDEHGEVQTYDGEPVFLNRSIPEDPEIKKLLLPYTEKLHSLVNEVIGFAEDNLIADTCGSQECAIGDIIADSFLDATKQMNESDLPHVALVLRNMIRGSIGHGNITRGEVINALPFTNKVVTFRLPGRHFVEALERCMTNYWEAKPFNGPWMPHLSGVQVILNTTKGSVESVLVKNGDGFVPLDPDKEYQIITLGFLENGGNGFKMFKDYGQNNKIVGRDADIFENYLKDKLTPVTPTLDKRITILS